MSPAMRKAALARVNLWRVSAAALARKSLVNCRRAGLFCRDVVFDPSNYSHALTWKLNIAASVLIPAFALWYTARMYYVEDEVQRRHAEGEPARERSRQNQLQQLREAVEKHQAKQRTRRRRPLLDPID